MLEKPNGPGFVMHFGSKEALNDFIDALEKHSLLPDLVGMYKLCLTMADGDTEATAAMENCAGNEPETITAKRIDSTNFEVTKPSFWKDEKVFVDLAGTIKGDELSGMRFQPFHGITVSFPKVLEEVAAKHAGATFSGILWACDFDHYDDTLEFSFENGLLKITYKLSNPWALTQDDIILGCKEDHPDVQSVDFSLPLSDEAKSRISTYLEPYYLEMHDWEMYPDYTRYPNRFLVTCTPELIKIKL